MEANATIACFLRNAFVLPGAIPLRKPIIWRSPSVTASFTGGANTPRILRIVGNPLIMKEMVKHVSDAGSYAPVTILIEERSDSVRISYDRMASYLAPCGNSDALRVARDLDAKIERILTEAVK